MCCCADGLDHIVTKNGKKRGRKVKPMPNNVLGYNLTTSTRGSGGKSVHRIHLRLRQPGNHHTFYPYEDIAGTMCHELAHCIRGPHDAIFYKAMDEIMEQHASFLARGIVADKDGFPIGSSQSYTLGGANARAGRGLSGTNSMASLAYRAAQRRIEKQKRGGTHVLGSSSQDSSSISSIGSLKHLPPSEAARIAAERRIEERRIQDSKYCLPCNEIIEILDESSDEEDNEVEVMKVASRARKNIINLVDSSDDDDEKKLPAVINIDGDDVDGDKSKRWACKACTFVNKPMSLACEICCGERA